MLKLSNSASNKNRKVSGRKAAIGKPRGVLTRVVRVRQKAKLRTEFRSGGRMRVSFSDLLRMGLLALALLIVSAEFSEGHSSRQKSGDLQVAVDLVLLDVSVQDKNGQPVHNLDPETFRIYEDKIEQPITSFSAEESPVTWGLVLDRSGSMQGMMKDVYESAVNVIDVGTNEDEMFIMTFNNKTETLSELTSDRRQLSNSIFGLKAEGGTAL